MDATTLFFTAWITLATLIIGIGVGWFASLRYNEWMDHASYSKVLFHPEMYDENGRLSDESVLVPGNLDDYFNHDEDED